MKIYLIEEIQQSNFARFSHLGTWSNDRLCDSCELSMATLIEPLILEWDPGSDEVGNFSWCGYTSIITQAVQEFLVQSDYHCRFGSVEIVRSSENTAIKRVAWPYEGPNLSWLIPTKKVKLNELKSNVRQEIDCPICEQKAYSFQRTGNIIDKQSWHGEKLFEIDQYGKSGAMFITEQALEELKGQNFTNLGYSEAGEIK